jgi:Generalcontrol nonderepressible 1 (Gcn1) N-terminal
MFGAHADIQFSEERKESPAMTIGGSSLYLLREAVSSILPKSFPGEKAYVDHVLIRLFVLTHHPMLPRYQWSWIDIARKANVDPGLLATNHTNEFISAITQKSWPAEKVIHACCMSSFVEFGPSKCCS